MEPDDELDIHYRKVAQEILDETLTFYNWRGIGQFLLEKILKLQDVVCELRMDIRRLENNEG